MKELISLRAKQPGLPIVICGDFNSNRKSLLREYFLFGMPEPKDGATLALSADGPYSAVWTREFNKKIERGHSEEDGRRLVRSVWKEDCYPWQQLWYAGPDSPFASERSKIVPLMDAFEELHDSRLAYTVPGEKNNDGNNMILDHMCVCCFKLQHVLHVDDLQISHSGASAAHRSRAHGANTSTATNSCSDASFDTLLTRLYRFTSSNRKPPLPPTKPSPATTAPWSWPSNFQTRNSYVPLQQSSSVLLCSHPFAVQTQTLRRVGSAGGAPVRVPSGSAAAVAKSRAVAGGGIRAAAAADDDISSVIESSAVDDSASDVTAGANYPNPYTCFLFFCNHFILR